jgi:hypothetical protein
MCVGNLAYLFLPVSCKNKWAKLEWPYGFVKSQKVRWHLTVLWPRFYSVDANELNRMANMPKANVRGKTKTQKRKRNEKKRNAVHRDATVLVRRKSAGQPGRITYNGLQAAVVFCLSKYNI